MGHNNKLNNAKKSKMDEFFTEYQTIEKELINYIPFFENKVIYCNCDNYKTSSFFRFFVDNFENFKIKKLICTWMDNEHGGICEYYDGEVHANVLDFNGDFRSNKLDSILNEADIVVTNPPFSLFRDFVNLMNRKNKKFIVLGNLNAIKYKDIFPLVQNNELYIGKSIRCGDTEFVVPHEHFDTSKTKNYTIDKISGNKLVKVPSIRWFTNLKYDGYNRSDFIPFKSYNSELYGKYDNNDDIINCDKVVDVPCDYYGKIGVPINFIDKYDSSKFEIIGLLRAPMMNHINKYDRIVLKLVKKE